MPVRIETSVLTNIGKVVKGLKNMPIPGNSPPEACKIAASDAINAPNNDCFNGDHRMKI